MVLLMAMLGVGVGVGGDGIGVGAGGVVAGGEVERGLGEEPCGIECGHVGWEGMRVW